MQSRKRADHNNKKSPPKKKRRLESKTPIQASPFAKISQQEHNDLQAFRKTLPICAIKDKLLLEFKQNQTIVIIGETGCMYEGLLIDSELELGGKTTQIPQYLLELNNQNSDNKRIAVTQPRRIAAISVAARVAVELGFQQTGGIVGHHVRFDSKVCSQTKLTFLTDGTLKKKKR